MGFVLFNSLYKKKEPLKPLEPGKVKIYTCGPTVYNFVHIGNLRTFVFEDLLVRYLSIRGYDITQVMNLTDIDDKTIKGANQEKVPLNTYTKKYKDAFFEDLKILNFKPAKYYPEATAHIPEMIHIIETLLKKNIAYQGADGSVYFSIQKFKDYGKLSGMKQEDLKAGAGGRVLADEYSKEEAQDFVLWKAWQKEDGDIFWETPLGKGRPGWHIECSAMSMKYLGESFDIHCGGVDNLFPHHENEIAQSEAFSEKPFVSYWMHAAFLTVQNEKMAKSKKNFYTLRELLDKGYSPLAIRYALLSAHYRQPLNFSEELLTQSTAALKRIHDFISRVKLLEKPVEKTLTLEITQQAQEEFFSFMDDDLNIAPALGSFFEWIRKINAMIDDLGNKDKEVIFSFLQKIHDILGVFSLQEEVLEEEINALIALRNQARAHKDFKKSDEIRDELLKKGIRLKDGKEVTRWERI